jgi:hypothetical protein
MKLCLTLAVAGFALLLASPASASSLSCPEMANLAPDDGANPKILEQRWQFTRAPDRPIYMVCRYHGTDETVKQEVPADVKQCRLSGLVSEQGEVVGSPSLECD